MAESSASSRKDRTALLPVILLGVLVVSVVVAWVLTISRRLPAGRGGELLAEIRHSGLSAYWPADRDAWFLLKVGGRVVGWRASALTRMADGSYEGVDVVSHRIGGLVRYWEWWHLTQEAKRGQYLAGPLVAGKSRLQVQWDTSISLADRELVVVQDMDRPVSFRSERVPPDNYLPEGTLELALQLSARQSKAARFQMVFNNVPPEGQVTRLMPVESEPFNPSGSGVAGAAYATTVRFIDPRGGSREQAMFFDKEGRLLQQTDLGGLWTAASQAEVAEHFPTAAAMVELVRQSPIVQAARANSGSIEPMSPAKEPPEDPPRTPQTPKGPSDLPQSPV